MPSISGSDKALMYALGGVARGGATRGGYHSPKVFVTIDGTHYATGRSADALKILNETLSITKVNGQPHTATFQTKGVIPTIGQEVVITLGSKNTGRRLFAGQILSVGDCFVGTQANYTHEVSAIDFTWALKAKLVTGRFTGSASTIAAQLIGTYAPGYTSANVQSGLATVTGGITFTQEELGVALRKLAARVGAYFYIDYFKDLHFFTTESTSVVTAPQTLTSSLATLLKKADGSSGPRIHRALDSVVTRVFVEGGGGNALTAIAAGETRIPVDDIQWYQSTGGSVKTGAQILTHTGVVVGGSGSLVGPGVTPLSAPTATLDRGGSVDAGDHDYAVTFVTGSGETLPGPLLEISTDAIDAPSTAPIAGTPQAGTGPDPGTHQYAVTLVLGGGGTPETTASPLSAVVTTETLSAPAAAASFYGVWPDFMGSTAMTAGLSYHFVYTYSLHAEWDNHSQLTGQSGLVTWVAEAHPTVPGWTKAPRIEVTPSSDTRVRWIHLWRREGAGSYRLVNLVENYPGATSVVLDGGGNATATISAANAAMRTVVITDIPVGPAGVDVAARYLYRTAAGGSQLKLCATINDNTTTTFTDTVEDSSLGANIPVVNTAIPTEVQLANIPVGPSGVTSRKVYRTVAGGAQLKLLTTIADNTTTVYVDQTADGSLGANAPSSDTSGLTQPTGTVSPGATTFPLAGTGDFPSAGWAVIGNGQQLIKYTGVSGGALTGIPASGTGAITANISYGSTITVASQLTGIPASGTGAIVYDIVQGDELTLYVQVDDEVAQSVLANYGGGSDGDGIVEDFIQDRRLSYDECVARGTAHLALLSSPESSVEYESRDLNTQPGSLVPVNLAQPTLLNANLRIQQVTITEFTPSIMPVHRTRASSRTFSFDDLLQQLRKAG